MREFYFIPFYSALKWGRSVVYALAIAIIAFI